MYRTNLVQGIPIASHVATTTTHAQTISHISCSSELSKHQKKPHYSYNPREGLGDFALPDQQDINRYLSGLVDTHIQPKEKKIKKTIRCFLYIMESLLYYFTPIPLPKKEIDFIFLVHGRYEADYMNVLPFLGFFKLILPNNLFLELVQKLPPAVVDVITTKSGLRGLMVSTPVLPQTLVSCRKGMEREIRRVHRLIDKICRPASSKIVIGLGGWWPSFTRKGKLLTKYFSSDKYTITTGHTATVFSLYKTTEVLLKAAAIKAADATIAIFGCGGIGSAVAEQLLQNRYHNLVFVDINSHKLKALKGQLESTYPKANIQTYLFNKSTVRQIISKCHLGLCATSNISALLDKDDIIDNFIFLDDSRPEAIPRFDNGDSKFTLEGGLIKVRGVKSFCDFGFGVDGSNLLGCLSEAYMLALDLRKRKILRNTLGDVTNELIHRMERFFNTEQISIGDFKMGDQFLSITKLTEALRLRHLAIKAI